MAKSRKRSPAILAQERILRALEPIEQTALKIQILHFVSAQLQSLELFQIGEPTAPIGMKDSMLGQQMDDRASGFDTEDDE